ncbi:hypothetical protein Celaphus_00015895 [Cervus elaphus hippelaphus]|uniref:Uncharacterized protein n=1 Tax=Cervus elaphus hippelaphus TaxID=46360 RepID=A0A212C2I6_CEREH|nr:hypothetical protein Celaphus_00015895 [Cervus elaphus hippelaphus]
MPSGCASGEVLKHLDELTLKLSVEDVPTSCPEVLGLALASEPHNLSLPTPTAPCVPAGSGSPHGHGPGRQPGDPAREGGGSCRLLTLLRLLSQCVGLGLDGEAWGSLVPSDLSAVLIS